MEGLGPSAASLDNDALKDELSDRDYQQFCRRPRSRSQTLWRNGSVYDGVRCGVNGDMGWMSMGDSKV